MGRVIRVGACRGIKYGYREIARYKSFFLNHDKMSVILFFFWNQSTDLPVILLIQPLYCLGLSIFKQSKFWRS